MKMQLVMALVIIGIAGCGSEGGNKIVTPSGQTISATPTTTSPLGTNSNVASPAPNKPSTQPSTDTSTAPTSIQDKPLSSGASGTIQAPTLPDNAALVALFEFTGGFLLHYSENNSADSYDSPDGTDTVVLKGTDAAGDGQYSYTVKYLAVASSDGMTVTQKPVEKHIELINFKFNSKCLGEVVFDGKIDAVGWQIDHKDTLLTDFEYIYNSTANTNGAVSIVISGLPHTLTLNNVKVSAESKKQFDMSTTKFGSGTILDGSVQELGSQLQSVINNSCFL